MEYFKQDHGDLSHSGTICHSEITCIAHHTVRKRKQIWEK